MSGARILVVDRDPGLASLIGETLQAAGHRVRCFSDAAAALDHLGREKIDLAIIDFDGPDRRPAMRLIVRADQIDAAMILTGTEADTARLMQLLPYPSLRKAFRTADLLLLAEETLASHYGRLSPPGRN
jgi:DNA-binding response OmpR family regulator